MNRKILLDRYCNPLTGCSEGGNVNCDHDFPPESKKELSEFVRWTCSKCGMRRSYEVYD